MYTGFLARVARAGVPVIDVSRHDACLIPLTRLYYNVIELLSVYVDNVTLCRKKVTQF